MIAALYRMTRHCHACGQAHELGAHHDPEAP